MRTLFVIAILLIAAEARPTGLLSRQGNMLVYSEQFNNALWPLTRVNAFGATDTGAAGAGSFANTARTTDPLGGNNADFIQEDATASNSHFVNQTVPYTVTGGQWTFSVYAKAAGRTWIRPAIINANDRLRANFQLSGSGTVGTLVNEGTASGAAGTIVSVGNGWYLCTLRGKIPISGTIEGFVTLASSDNVTSYNGDNTSGVYLFGASLRGAAWSSTYVKTEAYSFAGPYFTDPNGQARLLTGGHVWPSSQTLAQTPADFTWPNWVSLNTGTNWSFQRIWIFDELLMSRGPVGDIPFQRTGPGNAADGGLKIDLSLYNQTFFDTLSNNVKQLDQRGIHCSVMFFQGVRVNGDVNAWNTNIWNTANNVNGVLSSRSDVYTLNNATHWNLATQYINKVVDTLNGFSNLVWEVGNEMPRQSTNFQQAVIDFVRTKEAGMPLQHLAGMTSYDFQSWATDSVNLNTNVIDVSTADWTSYIGVGTTPPATSTLWMTNPPAYTGPMVSLLDTDHIWGGTPDTSLFGSPSADARNWVWRALLRGHNPINQDYPGSGYSGLTVLQGMRKQMGYAKRYSDRVDMRIMMPANAMASTGFCLTNALGQYLAYQPDNANFTTKLPVGRYYYEKMGMGDDNGTVQAKGWVNQSVAGDFTWTTPGNAFVVYAAKTLPADGIEFDGADDYVDCGSSATLDDISPLTICAWVFMTGAGEGNARIVAKESAGGDAATCLFILDDGGLCYSFARKWSTQLGIWRMPVGTLAQGTWQHVAVTYTSSSTAVDPVLYLNGTSRTVTEFQAPTGTLFSDASYPLTIGCSTGGNQAFQGYIRDVRIYNRILAAGEIAMIYGSRLNQSPITTNLVGNWSLRDGPDGTAADGDVVRDWSGNGNNGTGVDGAGNTGLTWRSGGLLSAP